jgi:hypothetical protein
MNVNREVLSVNLAVLYKNDNVHVIVSFCNNICVSGCECNVVVFPAKLQSMRLLQASVCLGYKSLLELRLYYLITTLFDEYSKCIDIDFNHQGEWFLKFSYSVLEASA